MSGHDLYFIGKRRAISEHLREQLETYIQQFNGLVKLYRNKERLGLILYENT